MSCIEASLTVRMPTAVLPWRTYILYFCVSHAMAHPFVSHQISRFEGLLSVPFRRGVSLLSSFEFVSAMHVAVVFEV